MKKLKFILIAVCLLITGCASMQPPKSLPKTHRIVIASSLGNSATFIHPTYSKNPAYKYKVPGLRMDNLVNSTIRNYLTGQGYTNVSSVKPASQVFAKGVSQGYMVLRKFSATQKAYLRKLAKSSNADILVLIVKDVRDETPPVTQQQYGYLRGFGYWNMDFPLNKELHTFIVYGMYLVDAKTLNILGSRLAYIVDQCPKRLWSSSPSNVNQATIKHLKTWLIPQMQQSINQKIASLIN